ncbi:hypothetical protein UC34_03705 [Pandoraea vervacti]|uniref:Pili assembly chaperone N-terminal domain-containing protein n=1 Tax=Pandoraea vervacti TaxID=656178 RepID=A0ABN4FLT7_9BURK|nr:hypothetical protein UC34_03705 [Pandoraea vervacti]
MTGYRALVFVVTCLLGNVVHGADLQIEPVTVDLSESSTSIWIRNHGAESIHVTAKIFSWDQVDGDELLKPTNDVGVSPPRADIAPGARQRLRVIRRDNATTQRERAFRLIIDATTNPPAAVTPRYSLPVFVESMGERPVALLAQLKSTDDGRAQLHLINPKGYRAKVVDLTYRISAVDAQILVPDLSGYILPCSYKRWILPGKFSQYKAGHFEAVVNGVLTILNAQIAERSKPIQLACE